MNTTGYFTHPQCWKHDMGAGHPECAARLAAIEDRLLMTGVLDALDRRDAPQAPLGDIELAHDRMLVAAIRGLSDQLADDILAGGPEHVQIDPDTSMNIHTWQAALRAAGAAQRSSVTRKRIILFWEPVRHKQFRLQLPLFACAIAPLNLQPPSRVLVSRRFGLIA